MRKIENFYQCPSKQAEQIPASALEALETFVSDSSRGLPERLFAWPSMVSVASGLRWDDLLSGAPATAVLMKEGLVGFAEKPKRGESLNADIGGGSNYAFSNENDCVGCINCF